MKQFGFSLSVVVEAKDMEKASEMISYLMEKIKLENYSSIKVIGVEVENGPDELMDSND